MALDVASLECAHPIFTLEQTLVFQHLSSLPLYAVLGVLAGLVSVAFNGSLLGLRAAFQLNRGVPDWAKPAVGGQAQAVGDDGSADSSRSSAG